MVVVEELRYRERDLQREGVERERERGGGGGGELLRTDVRHKKYMWIQHLLFARTARLKLDGILSTQKKYAFVKEYLRVVFCLPHCSWSTFTTSLPP